MAEAALCRFCGHRFTSEEIATERQKVEALRAEFPRELNGYIYRVEPDSSVSAVDGAGGTDQVSRLERV